MIAEFNTTAACYDGVQSSRPHPSRFVDTSILERGDGNKKPTDLDAFVSFIRHCNVVRELSVRTWLKEVAYRQKLIARFLFAIP